MQRRTTEASNTKLKILGLCLELERALVEAVLWENWSSHQGRKWIGDWAPMRNYSSIFSDKTHAQDSLKNNKNFKNQKNKTRFLTHIHVLYIVTWFVFCSAHFRSGKDIESCLYQKEFLFLLPGLQTPPLKMGAPVIPKGSWTLIKCSIFETSWAVSSQTSGQWQYRLLPDKKRSSSKGS